MSGRQVAPLTEEAGITDHLVLGITRGYAPDELQAAPLGGYAACGPALSPLSVIASEGTVLRPDGTVGIRDRAGTAETPVGRQADMLGSPWGDVPRCCLHSR